MSRNKTFPPIDLEDAQAIAQRGFEDAISMIATIEILEAGNRASVIGLINDNGPGLAFRIVRDALLTHLVILVMRHFDHRFRPDDRNTGVVIDALSDQPALYGELRKMGRATDLEIAASLSYRLRDDPRCDEIRHYRNKEVAHASRLDPSIPLPKWGDLFDFAGETAAMCQHLHTGVGLGDRRIEEELAAYVPDAELFWTRVASRTA